MWKNIVSHPNVELYLSFHRAYIELRLLFDDELGIHHGIDFDDFALLNALACAACSSSFATLSSELCVSRSIMLRRLRPLEKIGLIAFHGGVADRRVQILGAGLSLVKSAKETIGGIFTQQPHIDDLLGLKKTPNAPNSIENPLAEAESTK